MILDPSVPEGIYIVPVNDSKYNYSLVDGKIIRSMNATVPIIEEEHIEEPKSTARKERAAKGD